MQSYIAKKIEEVQNRNWKQWVMEFHEREKITEYIANTAYFCHKGISFTNSLQAFGSKLPSLKGRKFYVESAMTIKAIDHIALPLEHVDEMLCFYQALGFEISRQFAPDFYSAAFGNHKINFHAPHIWKREKVLRGTTALPGCGDICFVWEGTEEALISLLKEIGSEIIDGPVKRLGGGKSGRAVGISRYVRDPDSNLLEFIVY